MTARDAPAAGASGDSRPAPSWDSVQPLRPSQIRWVCLGIGALVPGVVATCLRVFPPTADTPALAAAFIPYAVIAYLVAAAALGIATVRARRRTVLASLTGAAGLLLAIHLAWLVPLFVPDGRPAADPRFEVVALNLLAGAAPADQVLGSTASADVVVLVEITPTTVQQLHELGWQQRFPYSAGEPQGGVAGTAIYSRHPLRDPEPLRGTSFQQWMATVTLPGLGPVRVIAAHPCNPFCAGGRWHREHVILREAARANRNLPLIIAGDLNAVGDHGPVRALHADGLSSATDLAGAGWQPTYPANTTVPPLIGIDHVLVSPELTATSVSRFRVDGSDHLGIRAVLAAVG